MTAALRPLAVALVTALLVSSCNDEPQPRFERPTETPSPSESTSSAAAEQEPWEEKSKAGAVAFARHWIETLNDAQVSGDVEALKTSSSDKCVTCRDLAAQLESLYESGGRVETEGWEVLLVGPPPGSVSQSAEVTLRVARPPQRVFDGKGPPQAFEGDRTTFAAGLVWQGDQWLMDELVRFA